MHGNIIDHSEKVNGSAYPTLFDYFLSRARPKSPKPRTSRSPSISKNYSATQQGLESGRSGWDLRRGPDASDGED